VCFLCPHSALPSGGIGGRNTIACAVCATTYIVSGEARYPEAMGVYFMLFVNRGSAIFGSRPLYILEGEATSYVYYWPTTRQWLIGPDPQQSGAAAVASATLEATCPDDVPRWLVRTQEGWASTYPVAVVPSGWTFSPTSAAPTSVGNTPERSGHCFA
jgi:hypothetical protein